MKRVLIYLLLLGTNTVLAQDVYNQATNQLRIPSVKVGDTIYTDVVITVGQILAVGASYQDPGVTGFNPELAYRQFIQRSETRTFNISGSVDDTEVTGTGAYTVGRLTGSAFEGKSALSQTTNFSMIWQRNGQSVPTASSSISFFDKDYRLLGSMGEAYEVVSAYYGFPGSMVANDAGLLYQATLYRDSSKKLIDGKRTVTYSSTFESASSMILTVITLDKDNFGATTGTTLVRYRVGRDNNIVRLDETGNDGSTFLVMSF